MGVKENFDNLSRDAQQFLDLKIEEVKLSLVERLSLLFADALAWLVFSAFLLLALLCLLVAVVILLSAFIGLLPSLFVVALLLLVVAWLLYAMRGSLFGDMMVARLYKLFFDEKEQCDGEE